MMLSNSIPIFIPTMSRMQMGNVCLSNRKYGGAAGPLAHTVVAPHDATDGVDREEDAVIRCIACFAGVDLLPNPA